MGGTPYLVAILAYLLAMGGTALWFAKRRVHTGDEFMLAGRSLPLWVMVGTLLATWVGSGTVVGGAAFTYQYGPLATIFFYAGVPIGILILYFFLADKVRSLSTYTIPEVLERRYGPAARIMAAICILLAYVAITSYQFIGGGYVLHLTTGISVNDGSALTAVVIVFLAMTGGLFSVAYTDAFSAILILFGLALGLPFAIWHAGGIHWFHDLPAARRTLTGGLSVPQTLGYFLPLLMLILGEQNMYQRFAAARDRATARKSNIGFFVGAVVVLTLTTLLASTALILYPRITPTRQSCGSRSGRCPSRSAPPCSWPLSRSSSRPVIRTCSPARRT